MESELSNLKLDGISNLLTSELNSVFNKGVEATESCAIYGVAKYDNRWLGSRIVLKK